MTRLTLSGVSFWYPAAERPALTDVSLAVAPGEVVALVGGVGAGASTLLLAAAGLAPRVVGGRLTGNVERTVASAIVLPTPWTPSFLAATCHRLRRWRTSSGKWGCIEFMTGLQR